MLKKFTLGFVMLLIFHFSNTPNLIVLDMASWFNPPEFEKNITLLYLFSPGSPFYFPYQDIFYIEFILHKLGHIFFYSLLTFLFYINVKKNRTVKTWIFVTFFAFTDEIHQFFIVGRSGRLVDIMLDSSSCLLTLIAINVFLHIKMKKPEKTIYLKIKNNS